MFPLNKLFIILLFVASFCLNEALYSQKTNQYNHNNKRTGVWKKYYPNKRVRYVGQFKNGREIGVFKFYDISSSKHPAIIKTFFKNPDSLLVQFYTITGSIKTQGVLYQRKRVGSWKYFYANGALMLEENYKKGNFHGKQFIYYPNGNVTEIRIYKDGLLDGICRKFSDKGILIEKVSYKLGKLNGLAEYFELNGNIKETGAYKDGIRVGKWQYYIEGEIAVDHDKKKKPSFTKQKNN